jgi:hypothetical protein
VPHWSGARQRSHARQGDLKIVTHPEIGNIFSVLVFRYQMMQAYTVRHRKYSTQRVRTMVYHLGNLGFAMINVVTNFHRSASSYTTTAGMAVGVGAYDGDGQPISAPLKIEDTTMEMAPVVASANDGSFGVAYLTTVSASKNPSRSCAPRRGTS